MSDLRSAQHHAGVIGTTLGHYRIESRLGAGGMGEVYRAHDLRLDRPVALKFIHQELIADTQARPRFEREARALAALDHPNVGAVYGFEELDGRLFMVLAFIEGKTFREAARPGATDPEGIVRILIGAADGLQAAHARDIIHRDIKATNIMVTPDGVAKIVDFGLAVRGDETRLTRTGGLTGTPAYMAPEVIQGSAASPRSDVFSFGAVMYEALTGAQPFPADNEYALMHAIMNESPAPFSSELPDAIRRLEPIVRRCLEKDPQDRFAGAGEIADALRGGVVTRTDDRPTLRSAPARQKHDRRVPARQIVMALATLAIVAVAIILLQRGDPAVEVDPRAVVVLEFENISGDPSLDWMKAGLPELIGTALARSNELEVFDPQRMMQLSTDSETRDEIFSVAKRNGIGRGIAGSIIAPEGRIMIQARVIDLGSGRVIHSDDTLGEDGDDIFTMVGGLIAGLQGALEVDVIASGQEDAWLRDITTHSAEAYRLYLRGREALTEGRWVDVAQYNAQALEIDSTFTAAQVDLVGAYWNTGDPRLESALMRARAMRAQAPRRLAVHVELVDAIVHHDAEGTIQAAEELIELYPENRFFRYLLGRGFHTAGRHEECVATLAPLVDARYEWAWTYALTARSNEALGRTREAERVMELGLNVTDGYAELKSVYAQLLAARGETERPRKLFEEALASPGMAQNPFETGLTHLGLARLDAAVGDTSRAREGFLRAMELLPDSHDGEIRSALEKLEVTEDAQ